MMKLTEFEYPEHLWLVIGVSLIGGIALLIFFGYRYGLNEHAAIDVLKKPVVVLKEKVKKLKRKK